MPKKNKRLKIHVVKGDIVKIISGDSRGKIGTIKEVITKTSKVVVDNINFKTKHLRPKQENQVGQIIKIESPIHSSKVMLYSKQQDIASRYTKITHEDGSKQRILKKTNEMV